jgi:hypothetical protein
MIVIVQNEFDWKIQEKKINSFDHFKTKIEGLNIHFIHAKSNIKNAKPLIFIHGIIQYKKSHKRMAWFYS